VPPELSKPTGLRIKTAPKEGCKEQTGVREFTEKGSSKLRPSHRLKTGGKKVTLDQVG
jgi:hypothetical protein